MNGDYRFAVSPPYGLMASASAMVLKLAAMLAKQFHELGGVHNVTPSTHVWKSTEVLRQSLTNVQPVVPLMFSLSQSRSCASKFTQSCSPPPACRKSQPAR